MELKVAVARCCKDQASQSFRDLLSALPHLGPAPPEAQQSLEDHTGTVRITICIILTMFMIEFYDDIYIMFNLLFSDVVIPL